MASFVTVTRQLLSHYPPIWAKAQISCSSLALSLSLPQPLEGRILPPNSTLANSGHQLNIGCGTSLELVVVLSVLVAGQAYPFFAPLLNL